jgi:RNA polymerase sigma factor (TIGR02999 family)
VDGPAKEEVTRILEDVGRGDDGASARLFGVVYDELRGLARARMRGERDDHTLQPTALVHEAWLRLLGGDGARFENRAHFYGAAAEAMRRILVDHARARGADKRGGGRARETLGDEAGETGADPEEILAVHEALERLEGVDEEKSRLVKLRFFSGLSLEEIAVLLEVSVPTLKRRWRFARAWLSKEITEARDS